MARPLRLLVENGHYHVTTRTWDRSALYRTDDDRRSFLELLDNAVDRFDWRCLSYCLMDNHFHLLVRTPLANLPRGMQKINGGYAQRFNRHHGRSGPLFERRYNAALVQREPHLLEVLRYIALNPVRAGACSDPYQYAWSSHAAIAGLVPSPSFVAVEEVRELFAAATGVDGTRAYREFVSALAEGSPTAGPVLGDEQFVRDALREVTRDPEIPRRDWSAGRPPLVDLVGDDGSGAAMSMAYRAHGYTMAAIAEHAGCHVSTVSRRIGTHERGVLDCKI